MPSWLDSSWVVWVTGFSLASLVAAALGLPSLLARMPADYFVRTAIQRRRHRSLLQWLGIGLKNLLGTLLVAAGLAMLVLPGQGLLTLLAGLSLVDFPGKRRLEARIIAQPSVWKAVQWLREQAGRPPLLAPPAPVDRAHTSSPEDPR